MPLCLGDQLRSVVGSQFQDLKEHVSVRGGHIPGVGHLPDVLNWGEGLELVQLCCRSEVLKSSGS